VFLLALVRRSNRVYCSLHSFDTPTIITLFISVPLSQIIFIHPRVWKCNYTFNASDANKNFFSLVYSLSRTITDCSRKMKQMKRNLFIRLFSAFRLSFLVLCANFIISITRHKQNLLTQHIGLTKQGFLTDVKDTSRFLITLFVNYCIPDAFRYTCSISTVIRMRWIFDKTPMITHDHLARCLINFNTRIITWPID